MGFCVIKYKEGYLFLPEYGGTSIPPIPILRSLSPSSYPYSLPTVDTCSQKSHFALVFVPIGVLGTRNVSSLRTISAITLIMLLSIRFQGYPS